MDTRLIAELEARLLQERAELQELREMASTDRKPVELDQASVGRLSRMDALQMQAMASASERRRQARRQLIDAALERVKAGEYGYCIKCGEEIAERRLALDPAVPTCISCAAGR